MDPDATSFNDFDGCLSTFDLLEDFIDDNEFCFPDVTSKYGALSDICEVDLKNEDHGKTSNIILEDDLKDFECLESLLTNSDKDIGLDDLISLFEKESSNETQQPNPNAQKKTPLSSPFNESKLIDITNKYYCTHHVPPLDSKPGLEPNHSKESAKSDDIESYRSETSQNKYIKCLQKQVSDLMNKNLQSGTLINSAQSQAISQKVRMRQFQVQMFMNYLSQNVRNVNTWRNLIEESFSLTTPTWSALSKKETQGKMKILGLEEFLQGNNTFRVLSNVLLHSVSQLKPGCIFNLRTVFSINPNDILIAGDKAVGQWIFSTDGLERSGGGMDIRVEGMIYCHFTGLNKISSMELTLDSMSLEEQLLRIGFQLSSEMLSMVRLDLPTPHRPRSKFEVHSYDGAPTAIDARNFFYKSSPQKILPTKKKNKKPLKPSESLAYSSNLPSSKRTLKKRGRKKKKKMDTSVEEAINPAQFHLAAQLFQQMAAFAAITKSHMAEGP
mmetsp:Transcript_17824/g.22968  ORF Transcript_17824/g.22968 Transcript_17824/m.22968 type:complete len:498 (+) Transcript_17824:117-1610(+)